MRAYLFMVVVVGWVAVPSNHHRSLLAADAVPAVTPPQIEADWDRQDRARESARDASTGVTVEQDAAGGCDGVKTGKWGFHTQNEERPWWQVDLGKLLPLERILLFNRCDGGFAARNKSIQMLVSTDGTSFQQAFQNDGVVFLGFADGKPLEVALHGIEARHVRLQLPGKNYFHLDEVEIYGVGSDKNVALHRPATQSSTSPWSVHHGTPVLPGQRYDTGRMVERGQKLAQNLSLIGANVTAETATLEEVADRLRELPADAPPEERRSLDRRARWAIRQMALRNPLLDFDEILFVKRAPGLFPHMSDQYYGWWSRGGGGLYILSGFKGDHPQVRCLTEDWPQGNFLRPDLSYDGKRVLFAWCKFYPHVADIKDKVAKEDLPEDAFYHIYQMNVDGTGRRQLTHGRYDDFDARHMPDGEIVFLSTRKGTALQVGAARTAATAEETCPDSYVRCGGGNHRPVAVFTLHAMDGDGRELHPISAFENFEWTPSVAHDGRVLYARWDYIDRFNGPFISLWSTNPDGTHAQLVYGNYTTKPQCVFEARSIPNSRKLIFTACAHHSVTGGSLALLDPSQGSEFERPLTRLTPEVPFPETEGWVDSYYAGPYPLSEEHYLVGWGDKPLPKHRLMAPDDPNNPRNAQGIYLYDAFGNLTLLHRDPDISSMNPLPIRPRPRPPLRPNRVVWSGPAEGRFLLQDIYEGLTDVERGSVTHLRIVAVPPKVQPHMNHPVLGVSREDPGKFVLGTVPVESDGSAYFRVPSGTPVFFQALDEQGYAVQTMRSLTYVLPGETLACIGCHEKRGSSPPHGSLPLAAVRKPSKITPGPPGSWPLRYDELIQPVLDQKCVSCHQPGSDNTDAAKLDLTASRSYDNLMNYADGDLSKLAFERDRSLIGECPARQSKLLRLITAAEGHHDVHLDEEEVERIVTWMDTYAQRVGSFSPEQEHQLRQLRRDLADLLNERPPAKAREKGTF
ncbi:MAG: discoidin domain-containing protein [Pirellulaceae bacterium]